MNIFKYFWRSFFPRKSWELWEVAYHEYLRRSKGYGRVLYLCVFLSQLYREGLISHKEHQIMQNRIDRELIGLSIFDWKRSDIREVDLYNARNVRIDKIVDFMVEDM